MVENPELKMNKSRKAIRKQLIHYVNNSFNKRENKQVGYEPN